MSPLPLLGNSSADESKRQQQQQKLEIQIAGYKDLRQKLEDASAIFEQKKLTFDFQKVLYVS